VIHKNKTVIIIVQLLLGLWKDFSRPGGFFTNIYNLHRTVLMNEWVYIRMKCSGIWFILSPGLIVNVKSIKVSLRSALMYFPAYNRA